MNRKGAGNPIANIVMGVIGAGAGFWMAKGFGMGFIGKGVIGILCGVACWIIATAIPER